MLQKVEEGAFADALLGHRYGAAGLSVRDQALLTRLVYGSLAWQGHLDHLIAAFASRPPHTLDAPVRAVLRLALFQLCHLSKIPDFAAVSTAVGLIKRFRGGAAVSFVNAVLRRAAAEWQTIEVPAQNEDPAGYLAVTLSHPRWLVERWLAEYGFDDTAALLRADNEPAPTVLRVNRRRTDRDQLLASLRQAGADAAPTTYSPVGIEISGGGPPEQLPGYGDGLFTVQGEASQLVGFLLAPEPGDYVLDACAAPGGKTTHLAELMDDRGHIVALDPHAAGIGRVRENAERLGLSIIQTADADALTWIVPEAVPDGTAAPGFDRILVDAPCSGLGTLRGHPEVRWRRTPDDVRQLSVLQGNLLSRSADLVRPGGTLVYATCTLTREENEDNVASFLRQRADFVVDNPRTILPAAARVLVGEDRALRTFPHLHGLDGFFAMRFRHVEPTE
jgi:16S rRNA (cytosine967-C5)-methyltransferase